MKLPRKNKGRNPAEILQEVVPPPELQPTEPEPPRRLSSKAKKVKCDFCGQVFRKRNHNHRFCTVKCRELYYEHNRGVGRFIIFSRDRFRCFYCGRTPSEDGVKLQVDHIVPRSKRGKDNAGNLVTACGDCNAGKGQRAFSTDLLEEIKRRVSERNRKAGLSDSQKIKPHI